MSSVLISQPAEGRRYEANKQEDRINLAQPPAMSFIIVASLHT